MKTLWLMGIGLMIAFFACERLTQPRLGPELVTLQPAAVLVTEAWLAIEAGRKDPTVTVVLERDGHIVHQVAGLRDTVLADSGLQPRGTYNYQLRLYRQGQLLGRTRSLQITTLDTTSHDFEWEIIEFPSPFGSGALYDVAIINENDIWAVGEIYADSVQPWLPYNAVHWDGEKWEMKRLPFVYQGSNFFGPIFSVIAFNSNDVWFGIGSVIHWDGQNFKSIKVPDSVFPSRINKMWGTSSEDFYIVGNNGLVAHYDGVSWRRVDSGVETTIQDIWGTRDAQTEELLILCAVSNTAEPGEQKVIQVQGLTVRDILNLPENRAALTVWFHSPKVIFVGGDGIFVKKYNSHWQLLDGLTMYAVERIRGVNNNDVFVVGHFGLIMHFNGIDWQYYPRVAVSDVFYSCDYKNDLLLAVGIKNHRPIILRMWR